MYIKGNYIYPYYTAKGKKTSLPHVITIDTLIKRHMEQKDSMQAIVKSMNKMRMTIYW